MEASRSARLKPIVGVDRLVDSCCGPTARMVAYCRTRACALRISTYSEQMAGEVSVCFRQTPCRGESISTPPRNNDSGYLLTANTGFCRPGGSGGGCACPARAEGPYCARCAALSQAQQAHCAWHKWSVSGPVGPDIQPPYWGAHLAWTGNGR